MVGTTGLTWIFGFLALVDPTSSLWYPFIIFNSTQGFSIFLAFLCTKKIFKLYSGLLRREKKTPSGARQTEKPVLQEERATSLEQHPESEKNKPVSLQLRDIEVTEQGASLSLGGHDKCSSKETTAMELKTV